MDWLDNLLPAYLTYALGWTVVHALWQGLLVASVMALILMGLQKKQAIVRYRVAYGALLLMFGTSLVTFGFLLKKAIAVRPDDFFESLILRGIIFEVTIDNQSLTERIRLFFNEHLSLIVVVWLLGVTFFSLRLMGGLIYVQQLKTRHLTPLSTEWYGRLNLFKNRLGIHRVVNLAESALVTVPMVVGWLKPIILMPIGTTNAMSVTQVEAILVHELAHIGGRDYLLNILQSIIEVLFYFHPAVWWISANIRVERENRCDDVAVQICGNSLTYAKALLSIQEMQVQNRRSYGLAMTFASNRKHLLLKRIKRILNQPVNRTNIMEKFIATGLLLAVVTALSFGGNKTHKTESPNDPSVIKAQNLAAEAMRSDTIPRKGKMTITHEEDGRKVEMKVENGKIQNLKIDGKDIPKEDFAKYEDLTDEVLYGLPTPPIPPMPPMPNVIMPPMPPMPPIPAVPATPFSMSDFNFLKKEKDKDGNTILKVKKSDGSMSEIKITPKKEVYVDGEKLEEGKDYDINLNDDNDDDDNRITIRLKNKWRVFFDFNRDKAWVFKFDNDRWRDDWRGWQNEWKDSWSKLDKDWFRSWEKYGREFGRNFGRSFGRNFYVIDGDSLKGGIWNDSLGIYHLGHDSTRRHIIIDGQHVYIDGKRMRQDAERYREQARLESEAYRQSMRSYGEEQRRYGQEMRRRADELRRQAQSQVREYQQQMRESEREIREYERRHRNEIIRQRWVERENTADLDAIRTAFEAQMLEDGIFAKDKKVYEIELTEESLRINGKSQSREMFEKYRRIYEDKSGQIIRGDFTLKFSEGKN
jgi:beta-lactamase regulating signal transducer with metallopeptidase domain